MKSLIFSLLAGLTCIICFSGTTQANPTSYHGILSVGDGGLTAADNSDWDDDTTKIEWWVDDTTTPGLWHYKYIFTVPCRNISHMIIEASDQVFTDDNLFNLDSDPEGWVAEIGTYSEANGNPNMPGSMWGIKFGLPEGTEDGGDTTSLTIEFDSNRMPVWGDFYSKDGKKPGTDIWNTVYNAGFGDPDSDPTDPPRNGSVQNHLLVPDSLIPAPGALFLASTGICFVAWLRRRRTI